jgi:hypothetical protein
MSYWNGSKIGTNIEEFIFAVCVISYFIPSAHGRKRPIKTLNCRLLHGTRLAPTLAAAAPLTV